MSLEENKPLRVAREDTSEAENRLIEAVQEGDKKAFGQLVRKHQKRLFRFVYGLTSSFDQTEDIVQDAFVRAYKAIGTFRLGLQFYPWLATIARNLAYNQISREDKKESLDKISEKGFDPPSGELGPLEQLLDSEGQKRFYVALNALPAKYRTVFILRHFEDMDYNQIAAYLKIPPGTVDSRLHRARKMMVEALKDLLPE
ncbi:MAG: hypothetical protein DRP45_04640 [Candidatus Zixiibacteriota bacterium]|nr:MAG: hypothetical protein DRP45_04640 [candidate division Zixibacteria bacterium]